VVDHPTIRGWTTGGFVRRACSNYGGNPIENTVHESLAGVAGIDPRYLACGSWGIFYRSGHALKMIFLPSTRGGRETLDVPQLAGVCGSSMIESTWLARSTSSRNFRLS
jgi:hypothetical protein